MLRTYIELLGPVYEASIRVWMQAVPRQTPFGQISQSLSVSHMSSSEAGHHSLISPFPMLDMHAAVNHPSGASVPSPAFSYDGFVISSGASRPSSFHESPRPRSASLRELPPLSVSVLTGHRDTTVHPVSWTANFIIINPLVSRGSGRQQRSDMSLLQWSMTATDMVTTLGCVGSPARWENDPFSAVGVKISAG